MIDLYTWTTPNGRKVSICLEEMGVPYESHAIDITNGDQFAPEFLAVSPNNKIPAIRDRESGLTLMESGAILLWLAKSKGTFLPEGASEWKVIEWLMWQMGGLGPTLGQVHHFVKYNKGTSAYAEKRFGDEARRLYTVLETQLADRSYIAEDYSIADMAVWPWISRFEWQEIELSDYPSVRDWYLRIADRPAVERGYHQPKFANEIPRPN